LGHLGNGRFGKYIKMSLLLKTIVQKRKKGRQLGENIPKMHMVQDVLVVGQMKGI